MIPAAPTPSLGPAPFLAADCALTLREAIAEHRARVPGIITAADDPAIGPLFEGHDACHVLFGCSTELADEGRVDTWTLVATTMTLRRYYRYLTHPALQPIYDNFIGWNMLRPGLAAIADIPRIWSRARAMSRPWNFDAWQDWADVPVRDIRAAHGLRLLHEAA